MDIGTKVSLVVDFYFPLSVVILDTGTYTGGSIIVILDVIVGRVVSRSSHIIALSTSLPRAHDQDGNSTTSELLSLRRALEIYGLNFSKLFIARDGRTNRRNKLHAMQVST
mmetsp:Transcript_863/g.1336  ORF Transcript_863/g.1336 Transcript_863/m.1336 type:complete len:111 (+) Transcript_863:652-984(+)